MASITDASYVDVSFSASKLLSVQGSPGVHGQCGGGLTVCVCFIERGVHLPKSVTLVTFTFS